MERQQRRFTKPDEVNEVAGGGRALLERAISEQRADLVAALIRAGVNVSSSINDSKFTCLMYAADKGNARIVEMLLAAGAHVNVAESDGGRTALMYAARECHEESVKLLLAAGADALQKDKDGRAAVDYAEACEKRAPLTRAALVGAARKAARAGHSVR